MKVLAIDPGYGRCGVAVVLGNASDPSLIFSSCIETDPKSNFMDRLMAISGNVRSLILEHKPDVIAIEELYFTNNAKTALRVAEVRGMLLALSGEMGIPVSEINPLTVKTAITGDGRAKKDAVIRMVEKLVALPKKRMLDDEYDAIAIGLTALAEVRYRQTSEKVVRVVI